MPEDQPPPLSTNSLPVSQPVEAPAIPREAESILLRSPATRPGGMKKFFAPLAAVGAFLGKLKFVAALGLKSLAYLKTGGSMLVMMWVYSLNMGWPFAVGFVLLIFVHECGHLIAARTLGLKVSTPMFIPFFGALITLKEMPRNAWMEAQVGIAGPLLGSLGAAVCLALYHLTGEVLFAALAYSGFFINLFNLIPFGFLDGGRIVTALSPWLWLIGIGMITFYMFQRPSFLLIIIVLMSAPRLFSLFRRRTDAEQRYFEVTPVQRWGMAILYFGLAASLALGMHAGETLTRIHPG